MEFHQCDWSIVYMDCLSVLIYLVSITIERPSVLALLTKMYNQKLQIRATIYKIEILTEVKNISRKNSISLYLDI